MSLVEQLQDPECLGRAFARMSGRPGLWAAGVPMGRVRASPVAAMLHLSRDLGQSRYLAEAPARVAVAKADGTQRVLSVYGLRDRLVQRALLDLVQPMSELRFSDCSFGFRPGRSVAHAVHRAQGLIDLGFHWLIDADIRQCFDRIPRRAVLDVVAAWLDDPAGADLIARALGWNRAEIGADARGIPQGSCLSPWLCNVYLHAFDAHSEQANAPLVRYADDFLLFAGTVRAAERLMLRCRDWLQSLGLELHPQKTRLAQAWQSVRFLGTTLQLRERLAC
jgi:RNA-directed DNA polymerase